MILMISSLNPSIFVDVIIGGSIFNRRVADPGVKVKKKEGKDMRAIYSQRGVYD